MEATSIAMLKCLSYQKTKTKTKKKTKTKTKDGSYICCINAALIAKQASVPNVVESAWTIEKYFSFFFMTEL